MDDFSYARAAVLVFREAVVGFGKGKSFEK